MLSARVRRVRMMWGSGQKRRVYFVRQLDAAWWLAHRFGAGDMRVMRWPGRSLHSMLKGLDSLSLWDCQRECRARRTKRRRRRRGKRQNHCSERMLELVQACSRFKRKTKASHLEVLLYGKEGLFLGRWMLFSMREVDKGRVWRWGFYAKGRLFLTESESKQRRRSLHVKRSLLRWTRVRRWLAFPEAALHDDFGLGLKLSLSLDKQKARARGCFRKSQYTRALGVMPLRLRLQGNGKIKIVRHESRAHIKANARLYWCVCWHVKQWKLPVLGFAPMHLRFWFRPQGPPAPPKSGK
ncbi:MAG: hypothetical protein AAGJ35_04675 [Myxococcota bacterium]